MNDLSARFRGPFAEHSFFCVRVLCIFLPLALALLLSSCGNAGDGTNQNGVVKYYLEQEATASLANVLILEATGEFKPSFSLSGSGYQVPFAREEMQPFQERIEIKADAYGDAMISLTLYQENGKPYLTDTLIWKSSQETPPLPNPYFSEEVSADDFVYLVFPATKGKNVKEVWIEGDIAPASGKYYDIPRDDQVLVQLSAGDGTKTLQIRYRNIFGTEGPMAPLSILKKSQGPQNCKATVVATKTANGRIRTRIEAENEGPLFYKVTGDVETERDFVSFEDRTEEFIALSAGEGEKTFVVRVKDQAGNSCPDKKLAVTYDRTYKPTGLKIKDDLIWTDTPEITILPSFDYLEGDAVFIHVSGGILDNESTFNWIPYTSEVKVTLTPVDGTRHIFVQFKQDDTVIQEQTIPIYLQPFVQVHGTAPAQTLSVSNIVGMTNLSISGCVETYETVSYAPSFACTKSAATVSVAYHLKDGTSVTRSVPL